MYRLAWLCGSLVMGGITISVLARYVMPGFILFNRLVLLGEESSSNGFVAGADLSEFPDVGARGEVLSTLRPAGKVMVDDGKFLGKPTDGQLIPRKIDSSVLSRPSV